jgi:hypothetical protein
MALQPFVGPWPLFQFLDPGLYLHTEQHKHRINAQNTDIHALSATGTHDPSVRANKDGLWLRLRGHCDRNIYYITCYKSTSYHCTAYFLIVVDTERFMWLWDTERAYCVSTSHASFVLLLLLGRLHISQFLVYQHFNRYTHYPPTQIICSITSTRCWTVALTKETPRHMQLFHYSGGRVMLSPLVLKP